MLPHSPTKSILTALGDFWVDYFKDHEGLASLTTGAAVLHSTEYSKLLDYVLSSSLLSIPTNETVHYALLAFSEEECEVTESGYRVEIPVEVLSIENLVSTLFEPKVALVQGTDYEIKDNYLHFYVDIFYDSEIVGDAYTFDGYKGRVTLFWATNFILRDDLIYQRYGWQVFAQDYDSDQYRWLITALIYFYVNTKSVKRIETVINILFGLPFSRTPGEQVVSIKYADDEYRKIITTKNQYLTHFSTEILVTEGQVLYDYDLLARTVITEDYISNPSWYNGAHFPFQLLERYDNPDFVQWCLDNPDYTEYIMYQDEKYQGFITYNNQRYYAYGETVDVEANPLATIICSSTGTGESKHLYDLMDNVLKYNILHIILELNHDNLPLYEQLQVSIPELIQSGLPVYLYPFLEVIFKAQFIDAVNGLDYHQMDLAMGNEIDVCDFLSPYTYNSNLVYNETEALYDTGVEKLKVKVNRPATDTYEFSEEYRYSKLYGGGLYYKAAAIYNSALVQVGNDFEYILGSDISLIEAADLVDDSALFTETSLRASDNAWIQFNQVLSYAGSQKYNTGTDSLIITGHRSDGTSFTI